MSDKIKSDQPWHQREASGLVTLVTLALFISACVVVFVVLK